MKTRIILIALLLTLGTQAFAQFGRPPHRHYDYYDYYDYYDPYDGPHGPIEYRWGRYYDQYGRIIPRDWLGVSLYGSEYLRAKRQVGWGATLTTGGIVLCLSAILGGALESDYNRNVSQMGSHFQDFDNGSGGVSAMVIAQGLLGAACLGAGIPLWTRGNRTFYRIADDYNRRYGRGYGYAPSLTLGSSRNGLGLSLQF